MTASTPEPEPAPAREQRGDGSTDRGVAILLALAAIVGVGLGWLAEIVSSSADDHWQAAIRQETKKAAGIVEDVRYVYTDIAAPTFAADQARVKEQQYRKLAPGAKGSGRTALLVEAAGLQTYLDRLAKSLPLGAAYRTPSGGFDAAKRLAEEGRKFPDILALDPAGEQREGDDLSDKAFYLVLATIGAASAFLLAALAEMLRRRRRVLLGASGALLAATVIVGAVIEATVG